MLRSLEHSGPPRGLSPALVLSVGALAAIVGVPARQSRQRSTKLMRSLLGAPPRQLRLVTAKDVVFGPGGAWVEVTLPPAPAAPRRSAIAGRVVRLWAERSVLDCPVEAMAVLVAVAGAAAAAGIPIEG